MAQKGENKNPKCATVIPSDWPKWTGPAYWDGMTPTQAAVAWSEWVRRCRGLGKTPTVYRRFGE